MFKVQSTLVAVRFLMTSVQMSSKLSRVGECLATHRTGNAHITSMIFLMRRTCSISFGDSLIVRQIFILSETDEFLIILDIVSFPRLHFNKQAGF